MYTREIQPPRSSPIEEGLPLQGTWTRAFDEVDLLDIRQPYGVPLLKGLKDGRIKEWESFFIQDGRFHLSAMLCNLKTYRTATVIMYDREDKKLLRFRKIIPGGGWHLPKELKNGAVDSRSWGFFFRIHSWLEAETIRLDLDVEPKWKRPSFTAHAEYSVETDKTTPMAVSLLFAERRSMYAYKVAAPVRGDMVFGGKHISFDPELTTGIFCDFKGYYPYRMRSQWCTGTGFDSKGRRFGFSIAENQARESFRNNENALWVDGKLTPLPPVKITQPRGIESEWIIQDMEGMVDLVFTPQEQVRCNVNFIISRSDYETPLGIYNGVIVNSEGEEITLKNVCGIGEKLYLRV
ncbi:DUF2804 domain-containing protein [Leadbettera azotonutricia]|uniref:DUF2804 domain-containing protein n=1 Tax=Leadbettera azotonutricia (strain ATCC BAA-888 / DSM 13862 / ZAS-9) TaxID=545695 RepID=F5Y7G8_LEAAZ|nr:DUF2804 domain-containing protein [Leadbettera azotonutricia]AEF81836.1 hypothetical protein TREAZ_2334 [Leadbettera azotonutricia ZAS-9]